MAGAMDVRQGGSSDCGFRIADRRGRVQRVKGDEGIRNGEGGISGRGFKSALPVISRCISPHPLRGYPPLPALCTSTSNRALAAVRKGLGITLGEAG